MSLETGNSQDKAGFAYKQRAFNKNSQFFFKKINWKEKNRELRNSTI